MSTATKSLSTSYMRVRCGVTETTARLFMHKVREAMKSSERFPMNGEVEVGEFVVRGKEKGKIVRSYDTKKKKAVCDIEYSDNEGVKRMYIQKIDNYSTKELEKIFLKR